MPQRIGSGILDGGLIYLPAATGVMECLDSSTGKTAWKERLGGNLWGSVLLADGKLYVNNLEGKTFILAAGPQFQLLATNDLGEPLYAAPAASRGDLFLRTHQHLYCIAGRQ
jgi:outer membrane protein assembly factor BamB